MDELEFRRQAYTNPRNRETAKPRNREQEFMDAAQTSPERQQFYRISIS
ncbi:MAG: DUF3379 domain-containing protein [Shewanella sp.]|nr:DUF3379 domain-containing protein [Shewanella sp.]